jgi:ammonia channel protein AmtB
MRISKFTGSVSLALVLLLAFAGAALAQDTPDASAVAASAADTALGLNVMWVLLAGFLVFFMQAGFALVETGFTRAKNVAHTMMMNMMVFCIGAIGYWLVGFALQFGGVNHTYPDVNNMGAWAFSPVTLGDWSGLLATPLVIAEQWGIAGMSGFMLMGLTANAGVLAFFLFQMVFMDTAATIPTGSMAERLNFKGFILMGLYVSMFIYPLMGMWVWGGGWLANLGRTMGWGNGAVDFAGSGVVHMVGGVTALVGAMIIGPRIGKFNKDGTANAIPGHNLPMGILGTIILFFGWFGFNPGSALGFTGPFRNLAIIAAVNTLLAGAIGGIVAMFVYVVVRPRQEAGSGHVGERRAGRSGGDHSAVRVRGHLGGRGDRRRGRRARGAGDLRPGAHEDRRPGGRRAGAHDQRHVGRAGGGHFRQRQPRHRGLERRADGSDRPPLRQSKPVAGAGDRGGGYLCDSLRRGHRVLQGRQRHRLAALAAGG